MKAIKIQVLAAGLGITAAFLFSAISHSRQTLVSSDGIWIAITGACAGWLLSRFVRPLQAKEWFLSPYLFGFVYGIIFLLIGFIIHPLLEMLLPANEPTARVPLAASLKTSWISSLPGNIKNTFVTWLVGAAFAWLARFRLAASG